MISLSDLNPFERRLLTELLDDASTEYADHSCNDYFLSANDENRDLVKQVMTGDMDSAEQVLESDGQLFVFDFRLMHFLATRIASGSTLTTPELKVMEQVLADLARDEFGIWDPDEPEGRFQLDDTATGKAFAKQVAKEGRGKTTRDEAGYIGIPTRMVFSFLSRRCAQAAASGGSAASATAAEPKGSGCPGPHEKWLKQLKRKLKGASQLAASGDESSRAEMRFYVQHGYSEASVSFQKNYGGQLTVDGLESTGAFGFAWAQQARWEHALVVKRKVDWLAAANALEGAWLEEHQNLRRIYLRSLTEKIEQPWWDARNIKFAAFGLVATNRRQSALQLAKLQIEGVRRGFNTSSFHGPSTRFMFRVFADYLGVPPVMPRGDWQPLPKRELAWDPWFDQLLAVWRDVDPVRLVQPALAACDAHTHHAYHDAGSWRHEYDSHIFARTPIAVLLVWHLRETLGLAVPQLDHPMMNDMLPFLGANQPLVAEPDADLNAVRERMEADGFDAQIIRTDLGVNDLAE